MSNETPSATPPGPRPAPWTPWLVAPDSGFEVANAQGRLGLVQLSRRTFEVTTPFRFTGPEAIADLHRQLAKAGVPFEEAERRIDLARLFPLPEDPADAETTDLASIPAFMRWFENSYGCHTLAAIIHDGLIRDQVNDGALRSDTLADRFFRQMLQAAGVPFFKRWIVWTAVALRTRWAAGGWRQVTLVVWVALAVIGLALGVNLLWPGWAILGLEPVGWFGIAAVLPVASAPLWGRQYGASLVAAVAVPWILPPAVLGAAGWVVYRGLEAAVASTRLFRRRRAGRGTPVPAPTPLRAAIDVDPPAPA